MSNDKAQRLTAQSVDQQAQFEYGKPYKQLYEYQQITVATNLTTMLIKMNKIELKNNLEDTRLDLLWIDDTEFGKGYKTWIQDVLSVQKFSDATQEDWYPIDPKNPSDREIIISDRVQGKIRYDYNDVVMLQYFTNAEKLAEYINTIVESAMQTKAIYIQQFIYNCYRGVNETDIWTSVVDSDFITYVTPFIKKIKESFKNTKITKFSLGTAPTAKEIRLNQLTLMVKRINLQIALAVEKANLTNSMGKVGDPVHIKPTLKDLILFINQEDLIDIDISVKAGLFNAQFLDMPNVNIIQMSHIPLGTFRLQDRKFLQLSKNLDKVANQQMNAQTLYYTNALHFWFYIGVIPYVYGVVESIQYTESVALSTVVTVLALGEFPSQPTANDLDDKVASLNGKYEPNNATYSDITTTGAKMNGNGLYTGTVNLTFTVK